MTETGFSTSDSLLEAVAPGYPEVLALTGAGGKTTAMLRLAREAYAAGKRVLVTVTTKIYEREAAGFAPVACREEDLRGKRAAVYASGRDKGAGKLLGIDPGAIPAGFDLVLVEADGSAGRPLTAPRADEPVIPPAATTVVAVAGLDALGRPVSAMHRPEVISRLTGAAPGDAVTPRVMAAVLSHPQGNTRGRPGRARVIYLLNKADDEGLLRGALAVAELLCGPVLVTSRGRVLWSRGQVGPGPVSS